MKRSYTIVVFIFLSALSSYSQSQWQNHTGINYISEVESGGKVTYVCDRGGLLAYDLEFGTERKFTSGNSGLRGAGSKEIEINDDGTMWIAPYRGGLSYFDGKKFQHFYHINTGDTLISVNDLVAYNNQVFFRSPGYNYDLHVNGELYSYDGKQFKDHSGTELGNASHVAYDPNGILYAIIDGQLFLYEGDHLEYVSEISGIGPNNNIENTKYHIDRLGRHWVASSSRISMYDGSSWYEILHSTDVNKIIETDDGKINIIFRQHYGIIEDDLTLNEIFIDISSIPNAFNSLPRIVNIDNDSGIWFMTYSAVDEPFLYRYYQGEFTSYAQNKEGSFTEGLPSSLAIGCNGYVYSGRRALEKYDGNNWQKIGFGDDEDFNVQGLFVNPYTCDLWITYHNSDVNYIYKLDNDTLIKFPLKTNSIRHLSFDMSGNIYISSYNGLLIVDTDDNQTLYDATNSPLKIASSCHYASDSTLWVTGENTLGSKILASYKNGEWDTFSSSNSPIDNHLWKINEDSKGNIWVSKKEGILMYDGMTWHQFPIDVIEGNFHGVSDIKEDAYGNFWIATTNSGILYWDGYDYINYNVYNSGINHYSILDLEIDSEGNLWMRDPYSITKLTTNNVLQSNFAKGKVFYDANRDGVRQPEEVFIEGVKVDLLPNYETAITNSFGAFSFYNLEDSVTYNIQIDEDEWNVSTGNLTSFNFLQGQIYTGIEIGIYKENYISTPVLDIAISPVVCSEEFKVWLTIKNKGALPMVGDLAFDHDTLFSGIRHDPSPSQIDNGRIAWDNVNVPSLQSRVYTSILQSPNWIEAYPDTTILDTTSNGFEIKKFNFISQYITDQQVTDEDMEEVFLCSYDPNDKSVSYTGENVDNYFLKEDKLRYTIRFQNLGNYKAKNIIIRDTLDSSLDFNSLRVLSYSHMVNVNIDEEGIVVFRFDNINLPPEILQKAESNGFIKYEIETSPEITNETEITNKAYIYFDHNPAIITNETYSQAVDKLPSEGVLNEIEDVNGTYFSLYPNPSNDVIHLKTTNNQLFNYQIVNTNGQILFYSKNPTIYEILELPPGLYFCKIYMIGSHSYFTKKVVIQ